MKTDNVSSKATIGRRNVQSKHLLVTSLLTLALFAITPARAVQPVPVNVGITNVIADVGLFVADKRGYFATENLKVRFVSFDAAARMIRVARLGSRLARFGDARHG